MGGNGFAVSIMRIIRAEFENEHARILKQNPDELFDERAISREPIFAWASCGVIPEMTKALVRDLNWSGLCMALSWISGYTRP
jgi:hypothetical protein